MDRKIEDRARYKRGSRPREEGQILVEGLLLMLFLTTVLVVLMNFTKKQDEVLKSYELPEKIRLQKNR